MANRAASKQLWRVFASYQSCGCITSCRPNYRLTKWIRHSSCYPINDDFYGLTEEQKQLRQTVFKFIQKELAPLANDIDKNDDFPQLRDFFKKCGSLGLLGITAPSEYGGTEATHIDNCIVMEEMSRVSASIALTYSSHSSFCLKQFINYGTEKQKQNYLTKLISGDCIGAIAMSETSAGSDVVSMKCRAERKGDYYVLNGNKFWITNGPDADILVVYAKTDLHASKPQHGVTCFIVEKGMEGFTVGQKLDKLGIRGSNTSELVFEDCKVPVANILGKENQGIYTLFAGLDEERLLLTAAPVGIMQACCDLAFEYAHQRETFGQKIGTYQLIQGKMADMYTALNVSRSYLYNVARAMDKGYNVSKDCAAVYLFSAEEAIKAALDAIQILGGNGYINEYPAGRFLRDAKAFEIAVGTTQIRRLVIGRAINKEYMS